MEPDPQPTGACSCPSPTPPRASVGLEAFQEPVSWDQKSGRPGPEPEFAGEVPPHR